MPPAKKTAKKAAKKTSAKHAGHEGTGKDMRRAYEHLGRVEVLHGALSADGRKDVATLIKLAQQELAGSHVKHAAELLRAAEHLSFGALYTASAEAGLGDRLLAAIAEELSHKLHQADKRWKDESRQHPALTQIYEAAIAGAQAGQQAGSYRKALELARGAEALTHVKLHSKDELSAGEEKRLEKKPTGRKLKA